MAVKIFKNGKLVKVAGNYGRKSKNEVLLYYFDSNDININLKLTTGIYTNTPVTIPNLRDYNRIRIYTNLPSAGLDFVFECVVSPNYEKLTGYTIVTASGNYMRVFNVTTNGSNNTFQLTRMGSYTFPQFVYTNEFGSPDINRVTKIVGIKEDL